MAGMWLAFERRHLFGERHPPVQSHPSVLLPVALSSNDSGDGGHAGPASVSLSLFANDSAAPQWGQGPSVMLKGERHMGTNFLSKQLSHNFGQGFRAYLAGSSPVLTVRRRTSHKTLARPLFVADCSHVAV